MAKEGKTRRRKAGARRLAPAVLLAGLALAGCREEPLLRQVSTTPALHGERLNQEIGDLAERARPGVLGAGVLNLESGEVWTFNGDRRFPLGGLAHLVIAAAVLAEVDAGRVGLDERLTLEENDISPPPSGIAAAWPARREYRLDDLLAAMVREADNTAADVLLRRIGGPGGVSAWLAQADIPGVRIDRYARELETESAGMSSFRIAWKDEPIFLRALSAVPMERRVAAASARLQDPRDTATPRGMLALLRRLSTGELLSEASTERLLALMAESGRAERLAAGFPEGAQAVHAPGDARVTLGVASATHDVALVRLPDGRDYAAAVFLSGATLDSAARDALIAETARAAMRGVR
ncbi:MAG: serine hydrolase [Phenylobacterium sp.]|uniref:serine hydrolase n=1 Tax=Phenylobacterium sp. TaxID=1871053 RepID=UPI00391C3338